MNNQPIKLYLLTGFFGAGKTTFLKRLIDHLSDKKIGIIMNEFGKISIDGIQIKRNGIDILEINNGSIFCSCLKGSFIEGLITYSELPIDYLFVESSGMADPSTIEHVLKNVVGKVKGKSYDFRGTVCVVDGLHFLDQADLLPAIEKQVAASNLIIINKIDLIDAETMNEVTAKIRAINPAAELIEAVYCDFGPEFLERNLCGKGILTGIKESLNRPDNRPVTRTLIAEGEFDQDRIVEFLQAMAATAFRMKGFFRLREGWHQVDTVGSQIDIKLTDISLDASQLVIISDKGMQVIKEIFEHWDRRFTEKMILR